MRNRQSKCNPDTMYRDRSRQFISQLFIMTNMSGNIYKIGINPTKALGACELMLNLGLLFLFFRLSYYFFFFLFSELKKQGNT
jgi:hypothetical protein